MSSLNSLIQSLYAKIFDELWYNFGTGRLNASTMEFGYSILQMSFFVGPHT